MNNRIIGHVFEPKPEWMMTTMPHSDSLVTVHRVLSENGINSVIKCETHHGKQFECAVSWFDAYWRQVA